MRKKQLIKEGKIKKRRFTDIKEDETLLTFLRVGTGHQLPSINNIIYGTPKKSSEVGEVAVWMAPTGETSLKNGL